MSISMPSPKANNTEAFAAKYHVHAFTREADPEAAVRVEQIHAEGYLNAGYVNADALDELGRLDNSNPEFILDKARGSCAEREVLYLYAVSIDERPGRRHEGGMRVVNIAPEGSLDDIMAFRASKASIGSAFQRELYNAVERLGRHGVKELSALSLTNGADRTVSYALIRDALHRALRNQTGEKWMNIAAIRAHRALSRKLGEFVFQQVGGPFHAYRNGDPRTSNDLLLVPTISETQDFIENIARSIDIAPDSRTAELRFAALRFMADGLEDEFLTPFTRQLLRGDRLRRAGAMAPARASR